MRKKSVEIVSALTSECGSSARWPLVWSKEKKVCLHSGPGYETDGRYWQQVSARKQTIVAQSRHRLGPTAAVKLTTLTVPLSTDH